MYHESVCNLAYELPLLLYRLDEKLQEALGDYEADKR